MPCCAGGSDNQVDLVVTGHSIFKVCHGLFAGSAVVLVEHVDSHASSLDTGQDAVSAAGGDFVAAVQGNRVNRVLAFVLQVLASVEAADITCVIVDGTDTGDELCLRQEA